MIKCLVLLGAQGVIQDVNTHNISLFNIIENIATETLPALIPEFALIAILEREPDDAGLIQCDLRMVLADQVLMNQSVMVDFNDQRRVHSVATIRGMVLPTPGQLTVSLWYDERLLGEYSVEIQSRTEVKTVSS